MMCMWVRLTIKLKGVFYFGYVGKNNNNYYHKIQNGSGKSPNSAFLARIACKRHWRICGDLPLPRLQETDRESQANAGPGPEALGARWEVVSPRSIGNPLFKEMDDLAMRSPLYWHNLVWLPQKQGPARLSPTFMETCTYQMGLVWVGLISFSIGQTSVYYLVS